MPIWWINAGPVFSVAKSAALRITARRRKPANDALVAIVFSAAALETFINEAAALAEQRVSAKYPYPDEHPSVEQFASLCSDIERGRGSTALKFQMASVVFTGRPFAKDRQPYQDFALLTELRNGIVHGKEDEPPDIHLSFDAKVTTKPPKIARQLKGRGLKLGPATKTGIGAYVLWLDSPDVARWACNSASAMVQSILAMVPEPIRPNPEPQPDIPSTWSFRYALDFFYAKPFEPLQ